jgi:hypothetical protein
MHVVCRLPSKKMISGHLPLNPIVIAARRKFTHQMKCLLDNPVNNAFLAVETICGQVSCRLIVMCRCVDQIDICIKYVDILAFFRQVIKNGLLTHIIKRLLTAHRGWAKFLNLVRPGSKTNLTTPVGPFRCLVIISSVISRSGVSGL